MGDVEQLAFLQIVADQLQPHGHAACTKAGGHAHAGQTCQGCGQGEDVCQIVGQGVFVRAHGPGHCGGCGTGDHIALRKGLLKVGCDDAAHLLRLEVVGVVIAVREHIGAGENAALDFVAKPFGTGVFVHAVEVGVVWRAVAKFHPIKARQVAAGFGCGDDVVGRDGKRRTRQADLDQFGAQLFVFFQCGIDGGAYVVAQAFAKKFFGQADAQAFDAVVQVLLKWLAGHVERG